MSADPGEVGRRRSVWMRVVALALLCAGMYCYGLTAHGLRNWQEGQRALVAREMFREGRWLTPTVHGEPYIAKPPLMYWVSMSIGHAREALGWEPFVDETEVRLTVALAAMAGVLATFLVARRMLAPDMADEEESRLADRAAWWAALGLATGVLYFRSARVGEIDVLLVPFVVVAIGAIDAARRTARMSGSVSASAIALAIVASVGAVLTKGPPALLMIALASYGTIVLRAVNGCAPASYSKPLEIAGAVVGGVTLTALRVSQARDLDEMLGLVCMAILGAILGAWLMRLARPGALRSTFLALRPTHPLIVLGVPLLCLWGWGKIVSLELGAQVVADLASAEVENNLRLLDLESPTKNLGFFLYGVAPISIASVAALVWVIRDRPAFSSAPGRWTPFVWWGLAFIAFSLLGKGVARYLTPAWPGVALAGGLWLAMWLRDRDRADSGARPLRIVITVLLISAGLAQTWWYGSGREQHFGERTPRELARELLPIAPAGRVGTYEFSAPALDFYLDQRVVQWERKPKNPARTVERLIETVGESAGYLLLTREETPHVVRQFDSVLDRLRAAGFTIERIETQADYQRPEERASVVAYWVSRPAASPGG